MAGEQASPPDVGAAIGPGRGKMAMLIIGLTGPQGAGRTEAAKHLENSHGFHAIRLSSFLREHDEALVGVEALQDRGTRLRREHGNGVLARQALDQAREEGCTKLAIDGIKNPGEIAELRTGGELFVIAVEASAEGRYARISEHYARDRTAFDRNDERDAREVDEFEQPILHGQRVQDCVLLADAVIWNDQPLRAVPEKSADEARLPRLTEEQDGSVGRLSDQLDRMLEVIERPGSTTPTEEEVRMCQAYTIARRSRCLRRKVGAVLTNAAGYTVAEGCNNVPEGDIDCSRKQQECYRLHVRKAQAAKLRKSVVCAGCGEQLGEYLRCPKCGPILGDWLGDRRDLELCRAVHAEESAILQLARFGGVGIEGGTLYTTTFPCALCAKKIVQARLGRVVYMEPYPGKESLDFFHQRQIELRHFEGFTQRAYQRVYGD